MWIILVAVAVAVARVNAGLLYAAAPQDRGQYHRGSGGSYNYGYNTGDGVAKVEVKRPDGTVVGSYRYFDPNGKQVVRSYVADSRGFRILGNDLPVSPDTPAAAVLGAPALTAAVEGAAKQVVDASVHPNKMHSTIDIEKLSIPGYFRSYNQQQELVFKHQSDLLQEQQKIIEEQKRQLAALTLQQQETTNTDALTSRSNTENIVLDSAQFNPVPDRTLVSNPTNYYYNPHPTNYYYYPHRYNYDFPAGFAITGGLVAVQEPDVIGLKGIEVERNLITVGHRQPQLQPGLQQPVSVVSQRQSYQTPYVIGRT